MKKLLTLVFFTITLASCSSGSCSDSTSNTGVLLKKIIRENPSGSITDVTYVYNGKKMSTISFGAYVQKFFYSGNFVTKIESYNNNNLMAVNTFEYDASGKLAQYKLVYPNLESIDRYAYEYNDDNTISVNVYGSFQNGPETLNTEKYFLDAEGEIIKIERYSTSGTSTTLYSYDTKNNPFKNVTGFDKMLNIIGLGIKRNTLTTYETGFDGAINHDEKTITYNTLDFPVTMQFVGSSSIEHYYY